VTQIPQQIILTIILKHLGTFRSVEMSQKTGWSEPVRTRHSRDWHSLVMNSCTE